MTRKFLGTDGVRGRANTPPMTAEMALRLGAGQGAHVIRVHDVAETRQALNLWQALNSDEVNRP